MFDAQCRGPRLFEGLDVRAADVGGIGDHLGNGRRRFPV